MTLPPSPFKGLAYFGDSDTDRRFFFGRERESELVAANLMASRLTVLYGPSGVGKSSLLRAGVTERLRTLVPAAGRGDAATEVVIVDAWRDDPIGAVVSAAGCRSDGVLADALTERAVAAGGELYLVLDQMEEYVLYHGRDGGPLAPELEDLLTRPDLPVHVLLGIRDDALADLDALKRRVPALFRNLLRLDHLTRAAARLAIEGPLDAYAALGGPRVSAEDDFVESVLEEVAAGRVGRALAGRVQGAADGSSRRIEAAYLQLVLERVWAVERERGSTALRASTLAELGGAARIVEEHLERALAGLDADQLDLAASLFNHLVTPSGTKIAHGVADLAGYTNATPGSLGPLLSSLSSARIVRRLAGRAGGPPRYEIFHDVLAGAVLTWRDRFETERAVSRERERARARQRRLLALVGAATVALCLVGALAAYALVQRADARERAEEAKARELTVSAVSVLGQDPELSMLLALEAVDREPSRAAESALRAGLLRSRVLASVRYGAPVVAAVPSGGGVLGATSDGVVHRRDGTTVQVAPRLTQGAFSPSRQLLVGGAGTDVGVWDVGSGARRTAFSLPAPLVRVATDGRTVAAAAADGTVVVRRLTGSYATRVTLRERPTALAVRGHVIAAASGRIVRIFDDRGRALSTWPEERATILGLAIAPGSAEVVTTAADSGVRVRRVPGGALLNVMLGHLDLVTGATYVPDGTRLVTIGGDRRGRLWEPSTGRLFALLAGHASEIRTVATSADGQRTATGDLGGTVKISDATGDPALRLVARVDSEPVAVRWSRTGPVAVTSGADPRIDGRARIEGADVHLPGGVVLRGHDGPVTSVRYSADGSRVITASTDRDARIWDPRTGASLVTLSGHFGRVSDASFSRDGRWAVTAGPASAGIWDARTGELLSYLRGHEGPVVSAVFAPDGRTVLTAGSDRTLRSWRCAYCGPLDELVGQARAKLRAVHRSLTPAERAENGL